MTDNLTEGTIVNVVRGAHGSEYGTSASRFEDQAAGVYTGWVVVDTVDADGDVYIRDASGNEYAHILDQYLTVEIPARTFDKNTRVSISLGAHGSNCGEEAHEVADFIAKHGDRAEVRYDGIDEDGDVGLCPVGDVQKCQYPTLFVLPEFLTAKPGPLYKVGDRVTLSPGNPMGYDVIESLQAGNVITARVTEVNAPYSGDDLHRYVVELEDGVLRAGLDEPRKQYGITEPLMTSVEPDPESVVVETVTPYAVGTRVKVLADPVLAGGIIRQIEAGADIFATITSSSPSSRYGIIVDDPEFGISYDQGGIAHEYLVPVETEDDVEEVPTEHSFGPDAECPRCIWERKQDEAAAEEEKVFATPDPTDEDRVALIQTLIARAMEVATFAVVLNHIEGAPGSSKARVAEIHAAGEKSGVALAEIAESLGLTRDDIIEAFDRSEVSIIEPA